MAIQGLPTFTLPGEELAKAPAEMQTILSKILEGKQRQQELNQLNQYHQGQLGIQRGELELKQKEAPFEQKLKEAQAKYYNEGGGRGGVSLKNKLALAQQAMKDNPGVDMDKADMITSAWLSNSPTLADGTPTPPPSGNARYLMDVMNKSANTAAGLNQQRFGATLENMMSSANETMPSVVKYSGLLGGASGGLQKAAQLLGGENSADYQNYINFTRVDVPTMAGEFMRELGVNASDEQKKMYVAVVDPTKWDTNPEAALARWRHFVKLVQGVGKTISKSPSEIKFGIGQGGESQTKAGNKPVKKWKVINGELVEA